MNTAFHDISVTPRPWAVSLDGNIRVYIWVYIGIMEEKWQLLYWVEGLGLYLSTLGYLNPQALKSKL